MANPDIISPYQISIPTSRLMDLHTRLSLTTFPDELASADWDYGAPLPDIKRLVHHWQHAFSWGSAETALNTLPNFTTTIQCIDHSPTPFEPLKIHFIHQRSSNANAIPLLFCHGWPGSVLEVTKLLNPLTNPSDPDTPAFHVIAPSLPNFGFSEGTHKKGFAIEQYAETCHKLMLRLGYDEYVTQGGDWGWYVTRAMALLYPQSVKATHFNMDVGTQPETWDEAGMSEREKKGMERKQWFDEEGFGYNLLQSTKPQTIGYALADSPVALLSWVYEKLHDWTDGYAWTDDEVCTWVSVYWFSTAGAAASARIYYEMIHDPFAVSHLEWRREHPKVTRDKLKERMEGVKIGYSHFPRDIHVLPKAWMEGLGDVVFERWHEKGGHFAAWERPEDLVGDLREMFRRDGGVKGVSSVGHGDA